MYATCELEVKAKSLSFKFGLPIPFKIVYLNNALYNYLHWNATFEIKTLLAKDFHHSNSGTSYGILLYRNGFKFTAKM